MIAGNDIENVGDRCDRHPLADDVEDNPSSVRSLRHQRHRRRSLTFAQIGDDGNSQLPSPSAESVSESGNANEQTNVAGRRPVSGEAVCADDEDRDDGGGNEQEEEEEGGNGLPYPNHVECAFYYMHQTTAPRSWCLKLITWPYPFEILVVGLVCNRSRCRTNVTCGTSAAVENRIGKISLFRRGSLSVENDNTQTDSVAASEQVNSAVPFLHCCTPLNFSPEPCRTASGYIRGLVLNRCHLECDVGYNSVKCFQINVQRRLSPQDHWHKGAIPNFIAPSQLFLLLLRLGPISFPPQFCRWSSGATKG